MGRAGLLWKDRSNMEFQFKQKELLIFLRKLETEDAELMEFPDLVL